MLSAEQRAQQPRGRRFWQRLLDRSGRPETRREHAVTVPADSMGFGPGYGGVLELPGNTPFSMMHVYRFLRDAIPDISDAVWTWKRLCQTGYDVVISEAPTESAAREARNVIDELDRRVNCDRGGMDGLLELFYGSLFTYGAGAFEVVLGRSRETIHDVVPIDVWTVRFGRDEATGGLAPHQMQDGKAVSIPRDLFLYHGLDCDGTNPYGRSILRSAPFVVKIQQRLLEDMAKATRNTGWSKLHVKYQPGDRQRGESRTDYETRVGGNFDKLKDAVSNLRTDQNLVTFENVDVNVLSGAQKAQSFYHNHKAIEEQVITGTHLMPILLGRNYGTTETYGTAQYEIVNRQVATVNRAVKRMLERVYNFELSFSGTGARAKIRMRSNRTVDVLKEAQARRTEIENALTLRDEGLLDDTAAAESLGLGTKRR
jgi:hypothetical protein